MSSRTRNNFNGEILFEDFKEVKFLSLTEKLTEDELSEGLEPMTEIFRVCITNHAHRRMYGEKERYCDYEWVENLLIDKSTALINAPMNEDILVLSDDKKIGVVLEIKQIERELSMIIDTVIRKVIYRDGREIELISKVNSEKTFVV